MIILELCKFYVSLKKLTIYSLSRKLECYKLVSGSLGASCTIINFVEICP